MKKSNGFEKLKKGMLISSIAGASLLMGSKNVEGQEVTNKSQYKVESLDLDSVLENKRQYAEKIMLSYMNSMDLLYSVTKDDTVRDLRLFLEKRLVPVGNKDFDQDQQIYFIPIYEDDKDMPGIAMAFEKSSERSKRLHEKVHPGSYHFIKHFADGTKSIKEFSKDFSRLPPSSLIKGLVFYHEALHAFFEESENIFGQVRPMGHDEIGRAEHQKIHHMIFGLMSHLVGESELRNIIKEAEARISRVDESNLNDKQTAEDVWKEQTQRVIAILQEKGIVSSMDDNELDLWTRLLKDNFSGVE